MLNPLKCPFEFYDQTHYLELKDLTYYITHLHKCKLINYHIQFNPNQFFLCPYCLQAFVTYDEAVKHRLKCKEDHICIIKDDSRWVQFQLDKLTQIIELGYESKQLDSLKKLLETGEQHQQNQLISQPQIPYYQTRLPYDRPTLQQYQQNIQQEECVILEQKNQILFKLSERDQSLVSLTQKFFNGQTIKSININQFQHKITTSLFQTAILNRYDIPFNKEIFEKAIYQFFMFYLQNKIIEFIEEIQGDIEEENEDKIYYNITSDLKNNDILWVLANESNDFIRQCLKDHPWALFKFQTSKNFQEQLQELKQQQPLNEIDGKILNLKLEVKKAQETYRSLIQEDQSIYSQIQYESSLNYSLQKRCQDSDKDLVNRKTQVIFNDQLMKNLQNEVLSRYYSEIQKIEDRLQKYREEKQKESQSEVQNIQKQSEETISNLTPQVEKLTKEEDNLTEKENILRNKVNLIRDKNNQTRKYKRQNVIQRKAATHINQQFCIQCKLQLRNTIIKPCGHAVFCESCLKNLIRGGNLICPLVSLKKCWSKDFVQKYKIFELVNSKN